MTEAQYWGFIRAGLRSKSTRWPPRFHILNKNRRRATGKRYRYEHQCEHCKDWFKQADVEVDHIVPVGSLKTYEDLPGFVERLFCEEEGFRVLCKPCHLVVTNAERGKKGEISPNMEDER